MVFFSPCSVNLILDLIGAPRAAASELISNSAFTLSISARRSGFSCFASVFVCFCLLVPLM